MFKKYGFDHYSSARKYCLVFVGEFLPSTLSIYGPSDFEQKEEGGLPSPPPSLFMGGGDQRYHYAVATDDDGGGRK